MVEYNAHKAKPCIKKFQVIINFIISQFFILINTVIFYLLKARDFTSINFILDTSYFLPSLPGILTGKPESPV